VTFFENLKNLFITQRYELETLKRCGSLSVEISQVLDGTDSAHAECPLFGALYLYHNSTQTFAIECDISKTISHRLMKFGQLVQLDESCHRHPKWSVYLEMFPRYTWSKFDLLTRLSPEWLNRSSSNFVGR
jgi:hypothetical protein